MAAKLGRLWYVIGPSGAGKDSLLAYAREHMAGSALVFAHRYITRPATAGGENHVELSDAEFQQRAATGCFVLTWERNGLSYGIGSEVQQWLERGLDVVVNGSRSALPLAYVAFPTLTPIWITASVAVLAERLAMRGRESAVEIAKRLAIADEFQPPPGVRVLNNDGPLVEAAEQLLDWLCA